MTAVDMLNNIHPAWWWVATALVLGIIEVSTGTLYFLCLALAALAAGLTAVVAPWWGQLLVFGASALAFVLKLQPLAHRWAGDPSVKANVDGLIGREAWVTEAIDPRTGRGQVRVGGEVWSACCDIAVPEGVSVTVEGVRGAKLEISPDYAELREAERQQQSRPDRPETDADS